MERTHIYNYWNNLGPFYFDGFRLEYSLNGYLVPDELLDNEKFRLFLGKVSACEFLNISGFYFSSEDCLEFLEDAGIRHIKGYNLFRRVDGERDAEELRRKLFPKWANQARHTASVDDKVRQVVRNITGCSEDEKWAVRELTRIIKDPSYKIDNKY